jgi:hypothetical protein
MAEPDDKLNNSLKKWREGRASVDETRSLAIQIGNTQYSSGVPILLKLLEHNDGIVRNNAIVSLGFDLHFTPIVEKLLAMLLDDPDEDCRSSAAGALGNLCHDSNDRKVLKALGTVSLNDVDQDVRISAYQALLSVNGLPRDEYLRLLADQQLSVDSARVRAILAEAAR